jgi:RTX calcium-binding nonapeptide repeat (4 copies)
MAKFYATAEADIVGNMNPLPPLTNYFLNSPTSVAAVYPTEYYVLNADSLAATANLLSLTLFKSSPPPTPGVGVGAGDVQQFWKADSGDSYSAAEFVTILGIPGPGIGTEQDVNQFLFKFDDKIHGSSEDDMLCGWAGKDSMWGNDGSDEFYYGEGMGKDKILDLNKKKDAVILDTDLVKNFKKLKGDVKLKNDKVVLKFDSSDKLVIHGIDTLKDLKKVVSFDDFTDFA